MTKNLPRIGAVAGLLALLAHPAAALVEQSYLQWQESGDTVPNSADVRVYARALKTGCTGVCDPPTDCESMTETLFYRAQGAAEYSSVPMQVNPSNTDCANYAPLTEYFADIPMSALSGDSVFFYCEFADADGAAAFTARPGSPAGTFNAATPAFYLVEEATAQDFILHVTGDFHCVTPDMTGPGISGSFNNWAYQAMTNQGGGIYTYDINWPAGSALTIEFKFRNGNSWETLSGGPFANREYVIAPGATSDNYTGYWNDEEECQCVEITLPSNAMRVFTVDMRNQDPASYVGGVGIRGNRAPLNWDTSIPLTDTDGDHVYTGMVSIASGQLNTLQYKFLKNDGTNWIWEELAANRTQCLAPGFLALDPVLFSNYTPPVGTTVPVTVSFSQNMGCLDGVTGVSLQGSAAPLDWNAGSYPMSDADLDGVWTADVVFPAGTPFDLEYKTTMTMDGTNWDFENNISNRVFTISDDTPTLTLPQTAWDNWLCAPDLDITFAGGQVTLTWTAVPLATSYEVYSQGEGYPIPATLETTTTNTTVTLPATGAKFFVVKAIQ